MTSRTSQSLTRTSTVGVALLAAAGAVGAAACQSEINEKDVTARIGVITQQMVHQSGQSVGFAVSSEGTASKALGGATTSVSDVTSATTTMASGGMPAPMMRAIVGRQLAQELTVASPPSMMTAEEQFDEAADQLKQLFDERLFVDANFESKSGDTAVYLLHSNPTCIPLPSDTDPPGTVLQPDSECVKDLDMVAVRLSVREDGDGARVTVLIGPNRLELVAFIVHSDLLALEVDLAKAKAATDYIQVQLGQDAPMDAYQRLAGRVRMSLAKAGGQKITFAIAVQAPIDISTAPGSSGALDFTTAATDPLLSVTGDAVSKTATVRVGLGQTNVTTTWDPQSTGAMNKDLAVSIGGLYGTIVIDENARRVDLTDVGIGETKLSVRGTPIFDLNLNPSSLRRFSGSVTVNADDSTHIEIRPELDLSLAFDYASVAADYTTPPDPATLHDTYGVRLTAPGGMAALDSVASSATFNGGVKMVTGMLTFTAASVPAETVTVPMGKCLTSQAAANGSNAFLGSLLVTDCP